VTPASVVLDGAEPAPVGLSAVADDGTLNVPKDIDELGWWVGSKPMGAAAGTTLIAGHVDSAVAGLGYFAKLTEMQVGDPITVVDGLGQEWQFAVSDTQQTGKEALPAELFDTTGERKLALVTCGGEFDQATGHYTDNFIVWATPA
jgi:sortase (surface protein transpeptidase)